MPCLSFAQQKKDSKIIVTPSDTSNLINRVALWLYDNGYSIDQKDESVKFIQSSEKTMKRWGVSQKLRVLVKDSTMVITGSYSFNTSVTVAGVTMENTFDPVLFMGRKGSIMMDAWDEMVRLAKDFGSVIAYSK